MAEPLRSWKVMKFDVLVRQQTDFSCGAAVLATLFNGAYGKHTTEAQVLVNMAEGRPPRDRQGQGQSLLESHEH
jgi:hypothetical protein